jgi:hypothetical protein
VSEYAHELNATEEGRDLVAGNFRVPRSEDEMARFHAFVIGTVNNHSLSVVATPPPQVLVSCLFCVSTHTHTHTHTRIQLHILAGCVDGA